MNYFEYLISSFNFNKMKKINLKCYILFILLVQLKYSIENSNKKYILCEIESECQIQLSFSKNITKDKIILPKNLKCDSKYNCSFHVKKPKIFTIIIGENKQNLYIINYKIKKMKSENIKIILNVPKKINNLLFKVKINEEEKLFSNKLNNNKFIILNKQEISEKLNILIEENQTITCLYLSILKENITKLRLLDKLGQKSSTCSETDPSKPYLYEKNNVCYNECPSNTYLITNKKLCLDDCSLYSLLYENNKTSKTCVISNSCNNYCESNSICIENGNSISCICNGNYTGIRCNITLNETIMEDEIKAYSKKINETIEDSGIKNLINDSNFINAVKELGVLLKDSKKINKTKNTVKTFYEITENELSSINSFVISYGSQIKDNENLISLIGLSIFYNVNKLFSLKNIRQLDETENENNLKSISSLIFEIYSTKIYNDPEDFFQDNIPFYTLTTDEDMVNIIIVSNIKNNYLKYVYYCKENNLPYISIPYAELVEVDEYTELYLQLTFSSDVLLSLSYESPSKEVVFGRFSISRKNNKITNIKKISSQNSIINFPLNTETDSKFNLNLFKYFANKGVNIYNKNDESFQDRCFRNDKLKIDYPQKYRRESLYQNYTITGTTSSCFYLEYDINSEYIQMYCTDIENVGYYLLQNEFTQKEIDQSKRLPFRCANKFKNYKNNLALWIFTGISFLLILSVFLSLANSEFDYDDLSNSLKNDKILMEDFIKLPEKSFQSKIENLEQKDINKIEDHLLKESCFQKFCDNLIYVHPFFCLFRISLIQPKVINFAIFFNSLANLLGWNAFYYTEKMFERRIIKKHRNNFSYPMKYEFNKIICSIVTTVGINLVIRLITLTSYLEKTNIEQKMRDKTEEEKMHIAKEYRSSILIRNIIGIILVFALVCFFFYYCVIFCYIYVNTQKSWLYSTLWSLIWIWVIFSPILIIIISLCEKSGSDACAHYMKQLFLF